MGGTVRGEGGPEVVAHRGAHGDGAGENSVEAFQRAVELGVRRLETDVHLTADGVLVAMHDDALDRTTDGSGPVAAHRWADVARLHVRGGGRVPRLDQLLAAWDDVGWVLDAKEDAVVAPLTALLHRTARPGRRCSVGAFDGARLRRLRQLLPDDVAVAAGRAEIRSLVVAARTVAWFAGPLLRQLPADVVQVPVEESGTRIVDRRFVATCHAAGLPVEVWTVNEEAEMHRLIALGVDALITDRPELAMRVTASHRGAGS